MSDDETEQEVRRALKAGDLVGATAWYKEGVDLPRTLGATLAKALDAARLDDLYQIVTWLLAYDAWLESDDDRAAEPRDLPDIVDQRGHGRLADFWLARSATTPDDAGAMARALHCLDIAGRHPERPALVDRILALDSATATDEAIAAAIHALVELGDVDRATEVARKLGTAETWLALALALEEVDQTAATAAYDRVLALDPEHSLAVFSFMEHLRATGDNLRADELAARAALLDAPAADAAAADEDEV